MGAGAEERDAHTTPTTDTADLVEWFLAREPIFDRPEVIGDEASFEAEIAPDFQEIGASGRCYERAEIKEIVLGRLAGTHPSSLAAGYRMEDVEVRSLSPGLVQVRYTLHGQGRVTRRSTLYRRTASSAPPAPDGPGGPDALGVQQDPSWQAVFHQGTVVSTAEASVPPLAPTIDDPGDPSGAGDPSDPDDPSHSDDPDHPAVYAADLATQVTVHIDQHRAMLLGCLDGLTEQEARARLVPSATTLLGLVKHAVFVERVWFGEAATGRSRAELGLPATVDESFALEAEDTIASVRAAYRSAIAESRAAVAGRTGDDIFPGNRRGPLPLRWVYVHVLSELAQHCGHADILREQILARREA